MEIDTDELQRLYEGSEAYQKFFEDLAERKKHYTKTTVDLACRKTEGSRKEIIELFKRLAELDAGEFIVGRKGQPSRFIWSVNSIDVGKVATGETVDIEQVEVSEDDDFFEEESGTIHTFRLRKGMNVSFELPDDLTVEEVERLSTFLRSLPLG